MNEGLSVQAKLHVDEYQSQPIPVRKTDFFT